MRISLSRFFFLTLMLAAIQIPSLAGGGRDTPIAKSGTTVVRGGSERQKVVVKVHTTPFGRDCLCPCPAARVLKELGLEQISIINNLEISVNGKAIVVPSTVYERLFDPHWASLLLEKESSILKIDGMDAAYSYLVRIYFNREGVYRYVTYSGLVPDKPESDTRYFNVEIKGN